MFTQARRHRAGHRYTSPSRARSARTRKRIRHPRLRPRVEHSVGCYASAIASGLGLSEDAAIAAPRAEAAPKSNGAMPFVGQPRNASVYLQSRKISTDRLTRPSSSRVFRSSARVSRILPSMHLFTPSCACSEALSAMVLLIASAMS